MSLTNRLLPVCFLVVAPLLAQETILLRPDLPVDPSAPSEQAVPDPKGGPAARAISRVNQPSLTIYLPPQEKSTGTGILVCPGGGYTQLMIDREGHQVARWLNTLGVAAFVLKYRLPGANSLRRQSQNLQEIAGTIGVALDDAETAMRMIRSRAAGWKLQPDRIGMMGFSAGGHLGAMMGMVAPRDAKPDFLALLYPGIPPVLEVSSATPPTFLAAAHNDPRLSPVDHCVRFYSALRKAGVPAELLVFSSGGHGFALRKEDGTAAAWPEAFAAWLAEWQRLKGTVR